MFRLSKKNIKRANGWVNPKHSVKVFQIRLAGKNRRLTLYFTIMERVIQSVGAAERLKVTMRRLKVNMRLKLNMRRLKLNMRRLKVNMSSGAAEMLKVTMRRLKVNRL